MKKLRRALSLILAAATSLSMVAMSASADDPTTANTQLDGSTLKIPVEYSIEHGSVIQTVSLTYTMAPATITDIDTVDTSTGSTADIQAGTELTSVVTFSSSDTFTYNQVSGTDDITKYAQFDLSGLVSANKTGVYRYILSEAVTANTTSGELTASTTKYQVDVYVTYDANATTATKYKISYIIARPITTDDTGKETVGAKTDKIDFNHSSASTDLKVTAHVEGNFLDTDHVFKYGITIPVEGAGVTNSGVKLDEGYEVTVYVYKKGDDGVLNTTTPTMIVKVPVTDNEIGDEENWQYTDIELKDSEYFVVTGLPQGMIFAVKQYTDNDYTTRNSYTFSGKVGNSSGTQSITNSGDGNYVVSYYEDMVQIHSDLNEIDFYNRRDVVVDTGIAVDLYPCVLAMTIALCGGALFLSKKRSSEQ